MNNILDDNSSYQEAPVEPYTPKSKLVAFLRQVFTGTGMFYVNKKNRFRWFYFITFSYALLACLNMIFWANFRVGISILDHFHNKTGIGALSLFASIFIAYPIAFLHLSWCIYQQQKK